MSHWQGHAHSYSRAVEKASAAVNAAEDRLQETLRAEYPESAVVRVVHHRGDFIGHVTGWDHYGARVLVRNAKSGKESKWWAAQVEVVATASSRGEGATHG